MTQYLFVYNNLQGVDPHSIHTTVTGISTVTDWWHYLPNVYILSTNGGVKPISEAISGKFPGLLFFVSKLDLNDTNGVLNKDAWEWISKKNRAIIKIKPVSSASLNPLGSILGQTLTPQSGSISTPSSLMDLLNMRAKRGY